MTEVPVEVTQFNAQIKRFVDHTLPEEFIVFHQKVSLEALKRIVLKTPVDTGRLRGAWTVGLNSVPIEIPAPDKNGGTTIQNGLSVIQSLRDAYSIIYIANNLDYASYLEEGRRSKQAPEGMVAVTFVELEGIFNDV